MAAEGARRVASAAVSGLKPQNRPHIVRVKQKIQWVIAAAFAVSLVLAGGVRLWGHCIHDSSRGQGCVSR